MNKVIMLLLCPVFYGLQSHAQNLPGKTDGEIMDSVRNKATVLALFQLQNRQQKEKADHPDSSHQPRKALFKSLVLPGFGQVYNRQYWKLAVIYGGFTGLVYSYQFAQTNYRLYLHQAYVLSIQRKDLLIEPDKYKDLSPANAILYYDYFRRNRDLTIILTGIFWAVQSIDAYIDAKFQHTYSMDDRLSFQISPTVFASQTVAFTGFIPGLKLMLKM